MLGGGAATGALNSEKGNRLASTLGGMAGGTIGGVGGALAATPMVAALNKLRVLKNSKLRPWLTGGLALSTVLGAAGAGAYGGSELAKKL